MHLFVDISSHGLGHLAIAAPVLNALARERPGLRLTVRSKLAAERLRERIHHPFRHILEASDFGFIMVDALGIDAAATARAYQEAHSDWPRQVAGEAAFLKGLAPDLVLSDVSYLPLAGAAEAGIPAYALCSLNWADLFAHFFGQEAWAAPIHGQMLGAYRSARAFLRITPGMAMADLANVTVVGPIASLGQRHSLGLGAGVRAVLVAMGGIQHRLPVEDWPRREGIRWLVPAAWQCTHPDALPLESLGLSFTDLLCSVDAVLTKPGYGTFTEAACNGVPVLYQRRVDWPEQDCLIAWLKAQGRCREIDGKALQAGDLAAELAALWNIPAGAAPMPGGIGEVVRLLLA